MVAAEGKQPAPEGSMRQAHSPAAPREMRQWKTLLLAVAAAFFGYYAGSHAVFDTCVCISAEKPTGSFQTSEMDVDKGRRIALQIENLLSEVKQSANVSRVSVMLALNGLLADVDPQRAMSEDKLFEAGRGPSPEPDACPEEYKGSRYGFPVFRTGFVEAADCPRDKLRPLEELVTVLLVLPSRQVGEYEKLLASLQENYPGLPVLIAADDDWIDRQINGSHTAVAAKREEFDTPGVLWNRLVAAAQTPYVLVGRDLDYVDDLARLHRLIYVISSSSIEHKDHSEGIVLAGGASRNRTGHWAAGCLRASLRHYALTLATGYSHSIHDCMLCDTLTGPFLTRTSTLHRLPLDEKTPPSPLFVDWFLRVRATGALAALCPDSMFFTRSIIEEDTVSSLEHDAWRQFAAKWQLERVRFPSKNKLQFSCPEIGIHCNLQRFQREGILIPPCCIGEVASALGALKVFAKKHHIQFELNEGSALAAVKLRSFLPWDIDGDILIKYTDYQKFYNFKSEIEKSGCRFRYFASKNEYRYFHFFTPNVTFDMWCRNNLSEFALPPGMQQFPTLVKMLGHWVRGPWNPGLFARNRYGPSYLRHAQHWSKLGMKDFMGLYAVGAWSSCSLKHHHSCLNNYPTDGSFDFVPPEFS